MSFGGEDLFNVFEGNGTEATKRKNDENPVIVDEKRQKQEDEGKALLLYDIDSKR